MFSGFLNILESVGNCFDLSANQLFFIPKGKTLKWNMVVFCNTKLHNLWFACLWNSSCLTLGSDLTFVPYIPLEYKPYFQLLILQHWKIGVWRILSPMLGKLKGTCMNLQIAGYAISIFWSHISHTFLNAWSFSMYTLLKMYSFLSLRDVYKANNMKRLLQWC